MTKAMALLLAVATFIALFTASASAAPGLISYSGRLVNGTGIAVTTAVTAQFTFWDAPSGGMQLGNGYTYSRSVIPNADGLYSVEIGDMMAPAASGKAVPAAIFDVPVVWLNVQINGENLAPRARITTVGYSFRSDQSATALGLSGGAYITAPSTGTAVQNGAALLAAYQEAKQLTPNEVPLASDNRAALLVPPGRYDLGTDQLTLDKEFVDLIGLSTARENQYIVGSSSGAGTGVIAQTANDMHMDNLTVVCTLSTGVLTHNDSDPSAYFPNSQTTATVVKNCEFRGSAHTLAMRSMTNYPGTYINCTGENYSFGGNATASGTFINCTGGSWSFGGLKLANGTFKGCTGEFDAFGGFGTANGNFSNCTGGMNSFGGFGGVANGTFTNCTGDDYAFAGNGGTAKYGSFRYCGGGLSSFATDSTQMHYCIKNGVPYP